MSRCLLSMDDLRPGEIETLLRLSDSFSEVSARAIPKVPALRGKTVATLFFEDSTRTRLSFETAAKRLSADTMTFSVKASSIAKGESLRDTVQTLDAMGVDTFIVRHGSAGVPGLVSRWTDVPVVNAGDGWHEHPTQALLDCYTIRQWLDARSPAAGARPLAGMGTPPAGAGVDTALAQESGPAGAGVDTAQESGPAGDGRTGFSMEGLHVAIVGDVKHSRVARSNVKAFTALGARVTLVGPATLMPPSLEGWPVSIDDNLDRVLPSADVVYLLRLQSERTDEALIPSLGEYTFRWGLTRRRAELLVAGAVVMHPGPMNRGVEIAPEVADRESCLVTDQVRNGVAVRMAVLFWLLGGEAAGARPPEGVGALLGGGPVAVPPHGGGALAAGDAEGAEQ